MGEGGGRGEGLQGGAGCAAGQGECSEGVSGGGIGVVRERVCGMGRERRMFGEGEVLATGG